MSSLRATGGHGAGNWRILVACPACRRQYDASELGPGQRLRCLCGELLTPRGPRETGLRIVRCPSCGAPREAAAERCAHCRAPFRTSDRERNTVCPGCAARIADRARYCPSCGTRIEPAPYPLEPSTLRCPACARHSVLASRAWPEPPGNVLECARCGGLWIGNPLFVELERRSRAAAPSLPTPLPRRELVAAPVVYRLCPECGQPMHRRNYGGTSGVLIDRCSRHGLWFDERELEGVLDWIRAGGLDAAERRQAEVERLQERRRRRARVELAESAGTAMDTPPPADLDDLIDVVAELFRAGRRLIGGDSAEGGGGEV